MLLGMSPSGRQGGAIVTAFDRPSTPWLEILKKDTAFYSNSADSGQILKNAQSAECAMKVGYTTEGGKTTYKTGGTKSALLFANNRGGRYKRWLDGLNTYTNTGASFFCPAESKWQFVTYGGGGALAFVGGDVVVKSPEGKNVYLAYGGIGPALSTPKFKMIPKSKGAGGPNSFETHGCAYIFGPAEPRREDLSGFCLILNAAAAVGAGLLQDGAGLGHDFTIMVILGLLPPRPVIAFPMRGHTAGFSAGFGGYLGYVHPL
jgi:hypothetical protein